MFDLPGYTLLQRTYEGAETTLYRGRRDADGAAVAVKATRSHFPTARELARLEREFAILQDLRDVPGVVRARALERCGRGLALVMEDLGPTSLRDVLQAGKLDVRTALQIGISLSRTLGSIHALRVIHKDIKPHNVLIDEATGEPRIVDFGIAARLGQETQRALSAAALEGTLAYLSPEQTGRMNRAVDPRSDLYSLGATLYEALTGAPPFTTTNPVELIHCHVARAPAPPHERAPEIPRVLSDIVMHLLAKTPEERYQSARGLRADLEECLSEWAATGNIAPFPLGQKDWSGELRVPQKLYGREREVEALLSAFERARAGAPELVLVSGYSGVGKSALVNEIHRPLARQGGYLVSGKFDPISRDIPLAPVVQAFRELVRQVLAEPASALEAWKGKLLEAVGANGRVLTELIPELELVLGAQPEAAALGAAQVRNRFGLLIQRFLRALASPERPLAIFLDDLQWADPASLQVLELILGDPEGKHLLIIGAYRDNEVDAAHPLQRTRDALREGGAALTELTLGPLDAPTVTQIVADTLRARAREVLPLAALVAEKTGGNPFFLGQFLGALHEEGLLRCDAHDGTWAWDLQRIRKAVATDNVIDLVLAKLQRLPEGTRRVLKLGACIGHEFDLRTLSTIDERQPGETAADLWQAMCDGLVVPLDGDYRLLDARDPRTQGPDPGPPSAGAAPAGADLAVSYRFLHDRVLQAAYSLVAREDREEVHLRIGRLLRARSGDAPRDEDVLEVVRHLSLGAPQMRGDAERLDLARLELRAGRMAKARAAYQAAADYFRAGMELLGDAGWERDRDLCFALHIEGAECAYLSGDDAQAAALFDALLPQARSTLARARVHRLRMDLYTTLGKYADAVRAGLEGLALLGVSFPDTPEAQQASFGVGLAEVAAARAGRAVEELLGAPELEDPERKAMLELLSRLTVPLYYTSSPLLGTANLKAVSISLRHGHAEESAFSYLNYGFTLVLLGQRAEGHAFGRLALALNDRFRSVAVSAKLDGVFANLLYVREPLRAAFAYFERGHKAGLESGDFVSVSTTVYSSFLIKLGAGCPLEGLREEAERALALMQRIRDAVGTAVLTVVRQALACLTGRTRSRTSLSDDGFEEGAFLARLEEQGHGLAVFYVHLFRLQIHQLHGDHAGALAAAEEAERWSASATGLYPVTRLHFHACLARVALSRAAPTPEARQRHAEAAARHKAEIAALAEAAPMNFRHQLLLIEAEEARAAGRHDAAVELYDQAIALAHEHRYPQDEALANELGGKLYVELGRPKAARAYLSDAYLGYWHWGATAKAGALAEEHAQAVPDLTRRTSTSLPSATASTRDTTLLGRTTVGGVRDAALIVRAAQAIAGELDLPRVIERLVTIVLENAGAQRGALLLGRGEQLFVEATFGVEPSTFSLGPSAALEGRSDLARSVILYVARTGESVAIDDARADAQYAGDPYIAASQPRSLLCLPLLYQGRLSGALYLEHRETAGAFNAARVELLGLLSSQAAIAIENARLVAGIREAEAGTRRANERLEAEVAQRTEELRRANSDLLESNRRLEVELHQRERAEDERAALQRSMIEAQRARLAEMSTPLIPITDRIMVMPLVGTVDAERAAQVLEVALEGAQRRQASVVILDITGMRQIDTTVTGSLVRTAGALRLLGAEAVLTGVRAEVAQSMIHLGVDLQAMVTMGTLQGGIAYALGRTGESRLLQARAPARAARAR
uniref:Protein kinase n=1 Tax=Jahnella sp. MSr9139 TaxID=1434086 RepID=A0A4Y5SZT4_9BACT|nr:protein kinase [Jahnella sp. MSr9139]